MKVGKRKSKIYLFLKEFFRPTMSKIVLFIIFILIVILGFLGVKPFGKILYIETRGNLGLEIVNPTLITLYFPLAYLFKFLGKFFVYSAISFSLNITIFVIYYYSLSCLLIHLYKKIKRKKWKLTIWTIWQLYFYW